VRGGLAPPSVLVGGVAHLYQGDLDLGRHAVERLQHDDLGPGVAVEELSYGAVAVAQRLEELRPDVLVLVGAVARGRRPGTVERREVERRALDPMEVQGAVADAVTGYIGLDLVLDVAEGLGALPERTIVVEVEPARTEPSEQLSPEAETALAEALELVRTEVAHARARVRDARAPS
jgi:hydrogenase maturation protease